MASLGIFRQVVNLGSRTALPISGKFGLRGIHSTRIMLLPRVVVNVPSMGDSVTEGTLIEWYKGVGDAVATDEDIASVETDKVTVAIKAPQSGTIAEMFAEADETIYVGNKLLEIDTDGVAATPSPDTAADAAPAAAEQPVETISETTPEPAGEPVVINIPSLGDSVTEGTIVNWLKQPGEFVSTDEAYVVIETDKVSVDLKAPFAGQVQEHFAAVDDTVYVGEPVVKIAPGGGGGGTSAPTSSAPSPAPPAPAAAPVKQEAVASPVASQTSSHGRKFSIHFRHGKRSVIDAQIASERGLVDNASVTPVQQQAASYMQYDSDAIDPSKLPEFFGRLPALTEDEMERVLLGGAEPY